MGMDRYDQYLLMDCVMALGGHGCSVGREHGGCARGHGDHVGSQGRERVL